MLTIIDLFVIDTNDGMEDGPHDFGIVHSAQMIFNVEAENDLVKFRFLNSDALIAERRRQFSEEVR